MASTIEKQEIKMVQDDDFLEGKLSALHILFETYQELEIKGEKVLSVNDLLHTIRTLILNLEKQGGPPSWKMKDYGDGWRSVSLKPCQRTN